MEIKKVKLVYFSPTGTTQKVLESIAAGIAVENIEKISLTLAQGAPKTVQLLSDDLVIIGAPVYGGRLPVETVKRFRKLKANNTPAILIVLYGNREFEDALLELKNLSIDLGFKPVACGAFIGEHSFATKERPIANGRPDDQDVQKAMEFGRKIKEKVAAIPSPDALVDLEIPGRFPYEGGALALTVAPKTKKDLCTLCGICAQMCPTEAISVDGGIATQVELCIRCCACIKSCPEDARYWNDEMMEKLAVWLNQNCSQRKEPQLFGI